MSTPLKRLADAVKAGRPELPQGLRPSDLVQMGERVDVRRGLFTFQSFRWVLALMTVIAVYFLLWASDRYITEVEVYVKSSGEAAPTLTAASLLGGGGQGATDAALVERYVLSMDMLVALDGELDLRDHYSDTRWDFLSRLSGSPSREEFLDYYRDHVTVTLRSGAPLVGLSVQGFTPEFSQALAATIVRRAEAFINALSQQIAEQELAFVRQEVARARADLDAAQARLVAFQRESGLVDAGASGVALQAMVNELEGLLVEAQTEEKQLASFLNSGAPELEAARARVAALEEQIAEERAKLRTENNPAINEVGLLYRNLELELTLATDLYTTALTSLEQARVEASRQLKHLATVQSPVLPDEAVYPRRVYNTASAWLVILLVYFIGVLIYATVREHRDV